MIFEQFLIKYKSKTAVISDTGENYTYDELLDFSNEISKRLEHRSIVFCLCENSIGSLSGYISFIVSGVVPVMFDSSLSKEMLSNLLQSYHPNYLWLPTDRVQELSDGQVLFSKFGYSLVKLMSNAKYPIFDNLALLLTTSGSTGSPKLVRISYDNLLVNATSIADYLSIDENERPITTLPMNYSFGLSIINSHLIKGATILLTTKTFMEKEFWNFLKIHLATSLSGVPFTYHILKKLRFFKMNLPSLKTLTQAGGKLNNNLIKEFAEFCALTRKQFFVMYGQTEATARMSYLPSEYSLIKIGSMGVALPGGEFSLIDEKGDTIAGHDIVGELVFKGKNVSMGYAESDHDLNKSDENNGVLYTGDLAKRDIDNFYYVVGRKKRFIKLFGNRVNLDETEQILKAIIYDCACTGADDNMRIYITDKSRIIEIRNFISKKLGIHQSAFSVMYLSVIPKNPSGKTIYNDLDVAL